MCGRFGLFTDLSELAKLLGFEVDATADGYEPRWNIAPTSDVLAITDRDDRRVGSMMRWGLIPRCAKPGNAFGRPMFNARSETVAERPMFQDSFVSRRCLIPADGFFEWSSGGSERKNPWWIHAVDSKVITLAGIWSVWLSPNGPVESCAIMTTASNSLMDRIHDRMPVILDRDWAEMWLDDSADQDALLEACKPREWPMMKAQEANPSVGSTRNDGPYLMEQQDLVERQTTLFP